MIALVLLLLLLLVAVAGAAALVELVHDRPRSIPRSHYVDVHEVPPGERLGRG